MPLPEVQCPTTSLPEVQCPTTSLPETHKPLLPEETFNALERLAIRIPGLNDRSLIAQQHDLAIVRAAFDELQHKQDETKYVFNEKQTLIDYLTQKFLTLKQERDRLFDEREHFRNSYHKALAESDEINIKVKQLRTALEAQGKILEVEKELNEAKEELEKTKKELQIHIDNKHT